MPTTASSSHHVEVAIIGGGIAGLYCAYKLTTPAASKQGTTKNVRVFESTDHLGGRIWSARVLNGKHDSDHTYEHEKEFQNLDFCAEFGPMRIELKQQELLDKLLNDLGLSGDLEDFPAYASPVSKHDPVYELQGEEKEQETPIDLLKLAFIRILGRLDAAVPDDTPPDKTELLQKESARLQNSLNALRGDLGRAVATRQPDWKETLDSWINQLKESDYQLIRRYGVLDGGTPHATRLWQMGFWNLLTDVLSHYAVLKIRDLGTFYHLLDENPNAVEWLIFWLRGLKTSEDLKGIKGGMQRITEALQKKIGQYVLKEYKLRGIEGGGGLCRLTFENGEQWTADRAILALPKAPLEKLILTNEKSFPKEVREDVDGVFAFPMVKLFLVVAERWWERSHANRYATQLPTREVHYLKSQNKFSKAGMLLLYADRPASSFLANYVSKPGPQREPEWGLAKDNARMLNKAIQYLKQNDMKQIHPQNITEYGIRDWGRRPYSGANHAWRPERKSWEIMHRLSCFSLQDDPKQDSNNVHICGEAFSDYHGFIEGALRSAAHALHTAYPEEFDTETYWLCEGKGCFHPFIS